MFSFFCLIFTSNAVAQEYHLGAKAGINLSNYTAKDSFFKNQRLASHFGVFMGTPLSEKLSLNSEILFMSIGFKEEASLRERTGVNLIQSRTFTRIERARYLAVPINLRYQFTNSLGIDFGPQANFLWSITVELKDANLPPETPNKRTRSGSLEPEFGLNLGVTYDLTEKINVQLRFYHGIYSKNGEYVFDGGVLNVVAQLSVGYTLFKKGDD